MNYFYIYAAIAVAYQVFKFIRARQQAAVEAEKKIQQSIAKKNTPSIVRDVKPRKETVFFEGYGEIERDVTPLANKKQIISYENPEQKPLVENTDVKAYQIPKAKKLLNETLFHGNEKASLKRHPILNGLKLKSEIRKAFVYSEIFKTKF